MIPSIHNVLVVAAHPDDETLGCGGTAARLAAAGARVHIVILGEGLASRGDSPDTAAFASLHKDCQDACARLGALPPAMHAFADNRFDTVPLLDIVKVIEAACARFEPDLILTHHAGDLNIDHTITHRAVLTATRPCNARVTPCVWAFETPSATEWAFGQEPFRPDTFVDITTTIDVKVEAMRCYRGESRRPPHPRSAESLRALACLRGAAAGFLAAEAFAVVRQIYGQGAIA